MALSKGMIAKLAMVATDMAYREEDLDGVDYDGIVTSAALAVRLGQKLGLYPADHRGTAKV